MKRFLVDAFFVLLLFSIASYIAQPQQRNSVDDKIEEFESNISKHKVTQQMVEDSSLNPINENAAARLARDSSEVVIDIMDNSLSIVSELFRGFMK